MYKLLLSLSLAFLLIFSSCSEKNISAETEDLLLSLKTEGFSGGQWLFVSDQNGEILDVASFEEFFKSSTYEFYGNTNGPIMLTTLNYANHGQGQSSYHQFILRSVQGITPGSEFTQEEAQNDPSSNLPDMVGVATLFLEDYEDSDDPYLSVLLEDGHAKWNGLLENNWTYDGSTFFAYLLLREDPSDILAVSYRDGIPVHKWFMNVKSQDTLRTSFSSFKPSKTVSINKNVDSGMIHGFKEENNTSRYYTLSNLDHRALSQSSDNNELPELGYLDGFDKYSVQVHLNPVLCCSTEPNVIYSKRGAIPQSIEFSDYSFSLTNPSLQEFSFQFSNNYTYTETYFEEKTDDLHIQWGFYASNEGIVVPEIPEEVLEFFPDFQVDNVKLSALNFYDELDDYPYSEIIKDKLFYRHRDTHEFFVYTFKN